MIFYDESPVASAGPQTGSSGQDTSSSTTRASTSLDEDQQRAIDAMPGYNEEMNRVWGNQSYRGQKSERGIATARKPRASSCRGIARSEFDIFSG